VSDFSLIVNANGLEDSREISIATLYRFVSCFQTNLRLESFSLTDFLNAITMDGKHVAIAADIRAHPLMQVAGSRDALKRLQSDFEKKAMVRRDLLQKYEPLMEMERPLLRCTLFDFIVFHMQQYRGPKVWSSPHYPLVPFNGPIPDPIPCEPLGYSAIEMLTSLVQAFSESCIAF